MKIPCPFIPLRAETKDFNHTIHVIGRDYTFGADGLLTSVKSEGHELLAGPMSIASEEDDMPSVWDNDYTENESESFIMNRSDEKIVLCGAKQSERFIINTCTTVDYDGNVDIDFKLLTRGRTVAQCFGIADVKQLSYKLNHLWVDIPLLADAITMFHIYPNSQMKLADGTIRPMTDMSMSGCLPKKDAALPFKALLWLGNEERGIGFFAENDRNWRNRQILQRIIIKKVRTQKVRTLNIFD